jgi:pilus assembly protein CpaB
MGRFRSFIPFGVALAIALITSVLIYGYLQKKTRVQQVIAETQPVAVAATDLSWGTTLTKEMIKEVNFLKGSLPESVFSTSSSLVGRVLVYPVRANEPIFESRLAPTSVTTGGVVAVIGPKKRAVGVKVDKVIGVSGFIRPGCRVDVLITLTTGKTYNPVTKTILENLLVLAVGSETKEKKGLEERASTAVLGLADVITLEVTPEEAEKLAMAAVEGRIQLVLRNFNDAENVLTPGVTIPSLLGSYSSRGPVKETMAALQKETETKKPALPPLPPTPAVEEKVEDKKPPVVEDTKPAQSQDTKSPGGEAPQPAQAEKKPSVFVVELIKGSKVNEIKFEESE